MRLLPVLLLVVLLSTLLDYIHVAYMCRGCVFPSPMFIMFSVTLTTPAVAIYALTATKTREGEVHGEIDPSVIASLLREPDRSIYVLSKTWRRGSCSNGGKGAGAKQVKGVEGRPETAGKRPCDFGKHRGRLVMRLRAKQLCL